MNPPLEELDEQGENRPFEFYRMHSTIPLLLNNKATAPSFAISIKEIKKNVKTQFKADLIYCIFISFYVKLCKFFSPQNRETIKYC